MINVIEGLLVAAVLRGAIVYLRRGDMPTLQGAALANQLEDIVRILEKRMP